MKLDRTGIILYVLNYTECVMFYQDVLELPVLFQTSTLTCFELGATYLMVEQEDETVELNDGRAKTCIRMNVSNIKEEADRLKRLGIKVDYQEHDWGIVAKFHDPDGNLCALKDSQLFEKQVEEGKNY